MKSVDVIIIGSGLFGSMTARHFRSKKLSTWVIDSMDPMAASKCSFGIWKNGWVNSVIEIEVEHGRKLLEKVAGVEEIDVMNLNKGKTEKFMRADCSKILLRHNEDDDLEMGVVERIEGKTVHYRTKHGDKMMTARKAIIVAAGSWTPNVLQLVKGIKDENISRLDNLYGAVFNLTSRGLDGHSIKDWAPYRQSVLVQDSEAKFMFGDGATVKNPMPEDPRTPRLQQRLLEHLKDVVGDVKFRIDDMKEGFRPYLKKGSPDFINQHTEYVWSATGGAKNSTILCGHIALQLYDEIQG